MPIERGSLSIDQYIGKLNAAVKDLEAEVQALKDEIEKHKKPVFRRIIGERKSEEFSEPES